MGPTKWTWHHLDQVGFLEEMSCTLQEKEGEKVFLEGGTRSIDWR